MRVLVSNWGFCSCCRIKSIFDAEIVRPSRQSQEDISARRTSGRLTHDFAVDGLGDSSAAAPVLSDKSVIYTPGQQFLLSADAVGGEAPAGSTSAICL